MWLITKFDVFSKVFLGLSGLVTLLRLLLCLRNSFPEMELEEDDQDRDCVQQGTAGAAWEEEGG